MGFGPVRNLSGAVDDGVAHVGGNPVGKKIPHAPSTSAGNVSISARVARLLLYTLAPAGASTAPIPSFFMIDENLPPGQLPRYAHPESGLPWFACPACSSTHVRAKRLLTVVFRMNAIVTNSALGHYCVVPGSDRALDLEMGRSYDETPRAEWMVCGACNHTFRVDGAAVDVDEVYDTWDVVEDAGALMAIGVTLVQELDPQTDVRLVPLRATAEGERVSSCLVELRLADGPWMDEEDGEGASGVNVHPGNYQVGVPDWCTVPCGDDARWPDESLVDERGAVRLAYNFDADSLPTLG